MANEKSKIANFITVRAGKKMRIRTLAETRIEGLHIDSGTVADVTEQTGYELITAGKAEKLDDDAE